MTKNIIKISVAVLFFAGLAGSSLTTGAYPPYLRQAAKFGAKDCLFCHQKPEGGEGWNARGQWLIEEKDRRKADAVDVQWLSEYKEAEKDAEKKEGDKPETDKSDKSDKKDENKDKKEEPKKKEKPEES